jgi:carbon monoxide dehydrogenase subunit G
VPGDNYHLEADFGQARLACWDVLTDVERVASWVEILHSVEEIKHLDTYKAVIESRVGPVRLKAPLDVDVTVEEPGVKAKIHAAGVDPQVKSSITIDVEIALAAGPDGGTHMALDATYSVLGKAASMGGGIIKKKADKVVNEFLTNAAKELA